jgi:hypothetical protein
VLKVKVAARQKVLVVAIQAPMWDLVTTLATRRIIIGGATPTATVRDHQTCPHRSEPVNL